MSIMLNFRRLLEAGLPLSRFIGFSHMAPPCLDVDLSASAGVKSSCALMQDKASEALKKNQKELVEGCWMIKPMTWVCSVMLLLTCAMAAPAATIGLTAIEVKGDKMVNDSVLDVTWADVVPASLVPFYAGPNNCCGIGYVGSAQQWVSSLSEANYGGHNDWRLASLWPIEDSIYCVPSSIDEMGCLFNNELGVSYGKEVTYFGPFTTLGTYQNYWSATESHISPTVRDARVFYTGFASRGTAPEGYYLGALAVRTGQTLDATPPVTPIPATIWLLLSGIGGISVFAGGRKS